MLMLCSYQCCCHIRSYELPEYSNTCTIRFKSLNVKRTTNFLRIFENDKFVTYFMCILLITVLCSRVMSSVHVVEPRAKNYCGTITAYKAPTPYRLSPTRSKSCACDVPKSPPPRILLCYFYNSKMNQFIAVVHSQNVQ